MAGRYSGGSAWNKGKVYLIMNTDNTQSARPRYPVNFDPLYLSISDCELDEISWRISDHNLQCENHVYRHSGSSLKSLMLPPLNKHLGKLTLQFPSCHYSRKR